MHVRTHPRNAHTRSRIYTYALRTRRTKRGGATDPRTWWTGRSRGISSRWRLLAVNGWTVVTGSAWSWIKRNVTCDDDEETFAEDNVIPHVTLRIYLAISQNDRVNCRWTTVVTILIYSVRALLQRYSVDLRMNICVRVAAFLSTNLWSPLLLRRAVRDSVWHVCLSRG